MACNSAVFCPTKYYLLPSCSSRDSASDGIAQLSNMAAGTTKTASNYEMSSNSFFVRTVSLELSIPR